MPSRTQAKEGCLPKDSEMPASDLSQPEINDGTFAESRRSKENVNEELLRSLEEIYRPVLKMMKLFGTYFGDTSFNRLVNSSGPCRKQSNITRFYCGVVVAGLWLNFVLPLVSVFVAGHTYLLLLFSIWPLLVVLNGTVCLIVLPLTVTRKPRFKKFLCNLISIQTEGINLEKVKSKVRSYLIMSSLFVITSGAGDIVCDVVLHMNPGTYEPWDAWAGFRISVLFFGIIGFSVGVLPMVFFCVTSLLLESLFDDFLNRMALETVDLSELRIKHNNLCEIVELADSILSPLLLVIVGLFMPFMCFCLYFIANLPEGHAMSFIVVDLYWILVSATVLAVVMVFGSRVNEKVNNIN